MRRVFGKKVLLDPNATWPAAIWTVIAVTVARRSIDVPEQVLTTKNERELVAFLSDFPGWSDAIRKALSRVGYDINYARLKEKRVSSPV